MRSIILIICLGLIASQIVYIFWREEYRYSLPTPIPIEYTSVPINSCVPIPNIEMSVPRSGYLLHFFNPECPCSRFNLKHFNRLYTQFGQEIAFAVVIPEDADVLEAHRLLEVPISVLQDRGDSIAQAYGVYSTPQAVIIRPTGSLYFRGNYNKARFCSQPSTNFAQLSLESLLQNEPAPNWGPLASNAYGCRFDGQEAEEPPLFFWSQILEK
ncbi:MAG: redoxin domain-containing protein [Bacteroidota bacterium]